MTETFLDAETYSRDQKTRVIIHDVCFCACLSLKIILLCDFGFCFKMGFSFMFDYRRSQFMLLKC